VSRQFHAPAALPLKKRPLLHTLNRRLGGPQNLSASYEEKEYLLPPEKKKKKNGIFFRI
jgi:hypothetical protein